ncbi:MAG: hypothetical protein P8H43_01610, partial [Crocinitomicaceae bacterium]|nr:hypothetical protein [Crocinitomicaceae bacterium]
MKHQSNFGDIHTLFYSFIICDVHNKKNPNLLLDWGFIKVASTYSPTLKRAVPSAQAGLTSL